eukprot:gene10722-10799_t
MLIPCPHCGPRAQSEFTFDRPVEAITKPDGSAPDCGATPMAAGRGSR